MRSNATASRRSGCRTGQSQANRSADRIDGSAATAASATTASTWGDDDTILITDIRARKRDAIEEGIVRGNFSIENVVLTDDLRIDIRQEWVGYVLSAGKLLQCLLIIIGDCIKFYAMGFKLSVGISQLT